MSKRPPLAWVLNLDAENELEAGGHATPSASMALAMRSARERFAAELPSSDVVLDRDPDARARGLEGRCYCPTSSALRRLERAGARVPEAPPMEVLRRVNERGFAFGLGHLESSLRCTDETQASEALARPGRWLLKRGLGFAGRGQRRVDGGRACEADFAWIRASLRRGAIYVEPRVEITLEVALHGVVHRDGSLERGEPTVQLVAPGGAWRGSRRAMPGELGEHELAALATSLERVRAALFEAGYFGPFGIDAFRYRREDREGFHPIGELNARYTMAWGVGMGGLR